MSIINVCKRPLVLAWIICGLAALFYAYEYFLRILPSVMEEPLRQHFEISATGFGFLSAFYYYAYVPMQLPVGVLVDRFGPRRLLTFACIICVVGSLVFAGTTVFQYAALGRFMVGLGSAFGFVGVLKLASIWLPPNQMALAAGATSAIGTITATIGDNVLGVMVDRLGWQVTMNWSALIGVFLVLILWFFIRDRNTIQLQSVRTPAVRNNIADLFLILRDPQIWINGMYGCLVYLPTTVFAELWGIPYLTNASHLSHADAEFCNSMLFLGFTIGAPLNGYISDALQLRKLPMFFGAMGAAVIISVIIYCPGLQSSQLNILMFTLGLLYSSQSIVFAVGRELSPSHAAGTAVAVTNMMVMLGAMFFQPLVGKILDLSQVWHLQHSASFVSMPVETLVHSAADYKLALSILPIGIFMAAILTLFLRETYARTDARR